MSAESAALAVAIQKLSLQTSCAHCGKQPSELKRCPVCKQAWYCGAECQKAAWKKHKKTCAPPLSWDELWAKVHAADANKDWQEVLKWEGRMEELMEGCSDGLECNAVLIHFQLAHTTGLSSTGSIVHVRSLITLVERRVDLLGKIQRFRDQGINMCVLATFLESAGRRQEAAVWYQKARDVGAAHGFLAVECRACKGLGNVAIEEGRYEEGLDLLRNALAADPLSEMEIRWEIPILDHMIEALFKTGALDELEPVLQRYREASQVESAGEGCMCPAELRRLYFRARLHEVPCICPSPL